MREQLQSALGDRYELEASSAALGVATETTLGRRVVKVLPRDLDAAVSRERFLHVDHLAAWLQHPHAVLVRV